MQNKKVIWFDRMTKCYQFMPIKDFRGYLSAGKADLSDIIYVFRSKQIGLGQKIFSELSRASYV